ncbi:MAG: hypothetical protein AVDCRST_MAG05-3933 [uncultured Rubrobacteraceae bacterium]|uniref:Uncharacterized protein n=1 Tax=uncultured Rubrobacteraceae bacterium TaxID=349277 RepID=A0A6J4TLE1_9ACTN|nr:MAG: hypothetical protein AVDCRST_MAG05-3933 [uncultured Rubrobacteraceae bacterium]
MMSEQHPAHHGDLWPFVPEFEADLSPGENLDRWREAEAFFAPLSELVESSTNEQLQTVVYSAHNRASEHARLWQERVRELLQENRDAGRLTPFGAVLVPILERAGLTPKTLLIESGRIQEPHALEVLLRQMHGPSTAPKAGYLAGWDEPLGLTPEESSNLSWALLYGDRDAAAPSGYVREDWRELPRAEMFDRVIVAVDGAKAVAEQHGDPAFARHVDEALFPFLEAEQERAKAEGGA